MSNTCNTKPSSPSLSSTIPLSPGWASVGGIGAGATSYTTSASSSGHIHCDTINAGEIRIHNISLLEHLEKIEERWLILRPDPKLLEKHEALRQAYEHYKLLEALYCE